MQTFKGIEEVFEPDETMLVFSYRDPETGESRQWDLQETYRRVSVVQIEEYVPEEIRSYFNSVKNLLLYSFFHYGFVAIGSFLATTAVEMALRTLYPFSPKSGKTTKDRRSFYSLLKRAIDEGKVREEGFAWLQKRRQRWTHPLDDHESETGGKSVGKTEPYEQSLLRSLPNIRNYFAHPTMTHSLITFEMAVSTMRPCADIINQLYKGHADRQTAD